MRSKSRPFSRAAFGALGLLLATAAAALQIGFSAASIEPSPGIAIEEAGPLRVPVAVRIRRGYHVNSDRPNEPYLIPTSLTWDSPPFPVHSVDYPPAEQVRYDFSDEPLSVFSSRIEIVTTFRVESVPDGIDELRGQFRFQACNDRACLPPRTIPVTVPVRR